METNGSFIPRVFKIHDVIDEGRDLKTFRFQVVDWPEHKPGQFVELWVPGTGEFPVSIASPSGSLPTLDLTVKRVGEVTSRLFQLKRGDTVGLRGPFGKGFPFEEIVGYHINLVAGGIGLPPLMSFVREAVQQRNRFGEINLFYGTRTPGELLYLGELNELSGKGVNVHLTVDEGNETWRGNVGVVTKLLLEKRVRVKNSVTFICGPGIMMHFTVKRLKELGVPDESIFLSMEQHMKCGVEKCGHCRIGPYYVCTDGPVFPLPKLEEVERNFAGRIL